MAGTASAAFETTPPPARLLNRDFLLLWQGQLISQLGNQAWLIAMMFWTAETTKSGTLTGLVMLAGSLPCVLLGPVAGAYVDRHSRLRIVVFCDALRALVLVALAFSFIVLPQGQSIALLFVAAAISSACTAFFEPAILSLLPDLVPTTSLAHANSLEQFSRQASALVGLGIGGLLYQTMGAPALFLIDGISFLFSALTAGLVRLPQRTASRAEHGLAESGFLKSVTNGLQYASRTPGFLSFCLSMAVFNCLLMPIVVLLPMFVTDYLQTGANWYGFLLASLSAGSIAGFCLAGTTRRVRMSRATLILSLLTGISVTLVLLGQVRGRWLALGMLFVLGILSGIINILVLTLLQQSTPPDFRGRVLALYNTMIRALTPIGMAVGGMAGDLVGRDVALVYGTCGLLTLCTVLSLTFRRSARSFLSGC